MKRSKVITQQPKPLESPNIIDIKSVTIKHPNTSHKLSNTLRQAKRLARMLLALYIVKRKNVKIFWTKKNAKIIKQSLAYKGYTSSYNVDILIF